MTNQDIQEYFSETKGPFTFSSPEKELETEEKPSKTHPSIDPEKKSPFHWLWTFFKTDTDTPDQPTEPFSEETITNADPVKNAILLRDMRDVAKISLIALKTMSPEKLKEFKETREFEHIKEILQRHHLAK